MPYFVLSPLVLRLPEGPEGVEEQSFADLLSILVARLLPSPFDAACDGER